MNHINPREKRKNKEEGEKFFKSKKKKESCHELAIFLVTQ